MALIMLRYTVLGTSLSCDYVVRIFLSIFTPYMNKSYNNVLQ